MKDKHLRNPWIVGLIAVFMAACGGDDGDAEPMPSCGNGVVEAGEACDEGTDNADNAACTTLCQAATCGDGFVRTGVEECDDGANNADNAACTTLCQAATCGDGFVRTGVEECDDGTNNADNAACTILCRTATCGDGFVRTGVEECDDGTNNADNASCTSICTSARCGDGFVQQGVEACDNGEQNADTAACTTQCAVAICGDGIIQTGIEECDDGSNNSDTASCTSGCTSARCGDGFVQQGVEECDDGEQNANTAACTAACQPATCGDGFRWDGVEECDEGNNNADTASCTSICTSARCGDGFVQQGVEGCDDGEQNANTAACTEACQPATCGDGFLWDGAEECDDGSDNSDAASCTSICTIARCGDGFVQQGVEGCDDGEQNANTAACTEACQPATCGDGFLWDGVEECDDPLGEGCTRDCRFPVEIGTSSSDGRYFGLSDTGFFGASVAGAGDVNNDGFDDIIVGEPRGLIDPDLLPPGITYLYHGPISGTFSATNAAAILYGEGALSESGRSVDSAGDVNNDGFDDLLIGAPGPSGASGRAYLLYGPVAGSIDLGEADAIFVGEDVGDEVGDSVAGAGDVNNDGFDDIIIGAPDAGGSGRAYLFYGPVDPGLVSVDTADVILDGGSSLAGSEIGCDVDGGGDINRDGFDDLLITSCRYADPDGPTGQVGAVFVVYGPVTSSVSLATDANAILVGQDNFAIRSVADGGDINNDGFDDVIIGGPGAIGSGRGYVAYGPLSGVTNLGDATAILQSDTVNQRLGSSVAGIGDVNQDGFDDILIGASSTSLGTTASVGTAYVLYGPITGRTSVANAELILRGEEGQPGFFGTSVDGIGDVDADGRPDIVIGASSLTLGAPLAGACYIYNGTLLDR